MSLFVFWVETPEGVREIDEYAECYGEAFCKASKDTGISDPSKIHLQYRDIPRAKCKFFPFAKERSR